LNLQDMARAMIREYLMRIYDEEVYADDSDLWEDPDFRDLSQEDQKVVVDIIRNVKITVH
jgi:hypothetical protein